MGNFIAKTFSKKLLSFYTSRLYILALLIPSDFRKHDKLTNLISFSICNEAVNLEFFCQFKIKIN